MKKLALTLVLALAFTLTPQTAQADCAHGTALDINVMTGVQTISCNPAPTQADLERQTQDQVFEQELRILQQAAEIESRAYSEANPGKQLCVSYNLTHPNGVSQAGGGVCANAVEPTTTAITPTPIAETSAITQVAKVKAKAKPKPKAKAKAKSKKKAKK
jgi:DNA-binding transcriptional regulator YdaS (Cro superfamily)